MRTAKRAVHRLIAEAVKSLEAARRIAEAPGEAIRTVGALGDTGNLFVQAVEFDWSRLDSSIRHLPDFSEMAGIGLTKAPPHSLVPVASDHRRFKFYFPFLESLGEAPVREVDLLDDHGHPDDYAVRVVECWALTIVNLAEGVLGDDEVEERERRFPEPKHPLSPKAHAVRQELLNAWPKGLKGSELADRLDRDHDLCMETTLLSKRIVPELERAGCPVRNVRGVGYQLVPAAGAD